MSVVYSLKFLIFCCISKTVWVKHRFKSALYIENFCYFSSSVWAQSHVFLIYLGFFFFFFFFFFFQKIGTSFTICLYL